MASLRYIAVEAAVSWNLDTTTRLSTQPASRCTPAWILTGLYTAIPRLVFKSHKMNCISVS